jgi:hypothetical protein
MEFQITEMALSQCKQDFLILQPTIYASYEITANNDGRNWGTGDADKTEFRHVARWKY